MSFPEAHIPELVRYATYVDAGNGGKGIFAKVKLTARERRLYLALAILLSLNLSVICGALTFFGLLYGQ